MASEKKKITIKEYRERHKASATQRTKEGTETKQYKRRGGKRAEIQKEIADLKRILKICVNQKIIQRIHAKLQRAKQTRRELEKKGKGKDTPCNTN